MTDTPTLNELLGALIHEARDLERYDYSSTPQDRLALHQTREEVDRLKAAIVAEMAALRADLLAVAKVARPTHRNGGFFNPVAMWAALEIADRVLDSPQPAPPLAAEVTNG